MLVDNREISIRKMKNSELDKAIAIVGKEIYSNATLDQLSAWIKSMGSAGSSNIYASWYVAEKKEGKIVGCIRYVVHDFDFKQRQVMIELSLLAVDSDYQKRGIGTKLVLISLERLRNSWQKRGFRLVMIFLEADERNDAARKFYERVFTKPASILLEDLWGKDDGAVFYFKRFTRAD